MKTIRKEDRLIIMYFFHFIDFIKHTIEELQARDNKNVTIVERMNSTPLKYLACLTKYIIYAHRFVISREFFAPLSLSLDGKTEKAAE